ncbi:MAG: ABC transporter permease [Ruminococcaceae bacterium]|nr:ABC transporter permease [Oscillospiraceae bacterium]
MEYIKAAGGAFLRYRHLLINLVKRDISVKYRRSVLGLVWSVLNPLLMMLVMTFVFQRLFNMSLTDAATGEPTVPTVGNTGLPPTFAVYLLAGQLIFNFFNEATNTAMDSVLGNAGLIKKVYIPKYIFPLEKVIFSLVNTLFSFISLAIVMVFTRSVITWWALLTPVMLILLFIFNFGVGLILSSMVVFFRDIKHLYGIVTLVLTYMTPIFYTEGILGDSTLVLAVMRVNPMYWFVALFRYLVVYGQPPEPLMWLIPLAWALGTLIIGLVVFRKTQDKFILHI